MAGYTPDELQAVRRAAEEIAESAGRLAAGAYYAAHPRDRPAGWTFVPDFVLEVRSKGGRPADLQTTADVAVEAHIKAEIARRFPGHGVLAEESHGDAGRPALPADGWTWVVDPIDGTQNFVQGLGDAFCVSLGVCWGREPVAGAVYVPISGKMYSAAAGHGATCNGVPVPRRTSPENMCEAISACEFSSDPAQHSQTAKEVLALFGAGLRGVRMSGSAACNLCGVATGRTDAYIQRGIWPWDMAAGVVIVREAGGTVTDCDGADIDICKGDIVAAATPALHKALIRALHSSDSQ